MPDESRTEDSGPTSSEDLLRQAKEQLPVEGLEGIDSVPPVDLPESDAASLPTPEEDQPELPTPEVVRPPPTTQQAGYRSPARLSLTTRVLLVLWVPFAAIAAAASITSYRVLADFREAPIRVGGSALDEAATRLDVIGVIWLLALIATGAVFIAWVRRAYGNLEAFGAKQSLRWSVGWSIGAWFVPILNLWRPKQIVDDTWRASEPDLPRGDLRGEKLRPPVLHHVWWGLWIAIGALGYFSLRAEASDLDSLQAFLVIDSVSSIAAVLAAIAAYWVVAGTTTRQETRADRIFADRQSVTALGAAAPEPGLFERFWPMVLGSLAVGGVAFVVALFAFDNTSAEAEIAGDTIPDTTIVVFGAQTLGVGDCFEMSPNGNTETMTCAEAHTLETFALATHPAAAGAAYPGSVEIDQFAFEACLAELEAYLGSGLIGSGLDIVWFTPTADSWAAQDRAVICALTPIAPEQIQGSLAGSGGLEHEGVRAFGELQLGDCFDDQLDPALAFLPLKACAEPHDNEVYATSAYAAEPGTPYPGQDELASFALEVCSEGFPGYVGVALFDSSLATYEIWPSPFTWLAGDRLVACVLFDPDFAKLEGSMRDSER